MGNFVAGPYTATYNAKALGQTAEGFTISHQFLKRLVQGDAYGQTPQDAVYQGREQFVSARFIEAMEAGVRDLVEPYADVPETPYYLGRPGVLDVRGVGGSSPQAIAKSLVLTAIAGTPAANDGPATATFLRSILAEGQAVDVLLGPDLREVPVRLRVYPYEDDSDSDRWKFGTET